MSWVAVGVGVVSASASIYKSVSANKQLKDAKAMTPQDPGYQVNRGVINNSKILSDLYGNYELPGYNTMLNNINSNYASSLALGEKGATSGGDVLALAANMAYGKNKAINQLGVENAQGKAGLLSDVLQSNAAAGQEYVNKNAYDRERYQQGIRTQAALTQAGNENMYSAIDELSGTAGKALGTIGSGGSTTTPSTSQTNTTDVATARDTYNKWFYPDGSPRYDISGNPIQWKGYQGVPGSNAAYQ